MSKFQKYNQRPVIDSTNKLIDFGYIKYAVRRLSQLKTNGKSGIFRIITGDSYSKHKLFDFTYLANMQLNSWANYT